MIGVIREIRKNRYLYLLALPGVLFLVIFAYMPLVGHLLAFEDFHLSTGLFGSPFVGFDNFKFFFGGRDWITVTKNTVILNSLFLGIGLSFSLVLAVFINEMRNMHVKKVSQSLIFLPYFISWQVIAIMIYALLNSSTGFVNQVLHALGAKPVNWYGRPELWRAILTFANIFKYAGYNSIIFLATIVGISEELFESARIDGATRFQQVMHVTLPLLRPIFLIMLLMGIGRIFYGDFGMIYGIVGDNGVLFPITDVIDTYSYRTLRQVGNLSMSSAVVLYQSVMGITTIIVFNGIVRRVEPDVRLFKGGAVRGTGMKLLRSRTGCEGAFSVVVYLVVLLFALVCFFPFYLIVINSFVDNRILNQEGYQLYIKRFSVDSYGYLFQGSQAFTSYKVTLFVTAVGSTLATVITSMYAFVLSNRKAKYRNTMAFLTYIPMVMGTGLVGFYLLVARWLGLKDTIWALIFPYLLNPFLVFVLVNFFRALPYELHESAFMDGANDIYIFYRIILPVSVPGVATVILFYALTYWNDWWLAILFINHYELHPLQMMIRSLMSQINATQYVMGRSMYIQSVPSEGLKLATVCITIGPIVLLYPLVQRYFVKGLTLGAVKG